MLYARPTFGSLHRQLLPRMLHVRFQSSAQVLINKADLHIPSLGTAFSYLWLRDSCQSPACVHPSNQQKLHRSSDIPLDIRPDHVESLADGLRIRWSDNHESKYTWEFLSRHASPQNLSRFHGDVFKQAWNNASIAQTPDLYVSYESIKTPSGLLAAIDHICRYGLIFVRGIPNGETSNATCELRNLAERFSEIRETFYGSLWDVVNTVNSRNIAYTNLDLGLHMDLLYFQNPPQYQILHCLRNQVEGGASYFVDALFAAEKLKEQNPFHFDVLTSTLVPFHYIIDGHHLRFEHPTIELSKDGKTIIQLNYSPPFQAPLLLPTPPVFFLALREFTRLLNDTKNTYTYTLQEGDAVLFDNRRVLHARTAFQDKPGVTTKEGETNRWLKGCYIEADAMWDRGRVLRSQKNTITQ